LRKIGELFACKALRYRYCSFLSNAELTVLLGMSEVESGAETMNMSRMSGGGIRRRAVAIAASIAAFGIWGVSSASASLMPLSTGGTDTFSGSTTLSGSPFKTDKNYLVVDSTDPNTHLEIETTIGTLTSYVYVDGSFDEFVYQVSLYKNAGDDFDAVSLSAFTSGVTTSVGYDDSGGGVDPTSVSRTAFDANNDSNLDWAMNEISPGESSAFLTVDTNATQIALGNGAVQDDISGNASIDVPFLMPTVPEPASMGLIIVAGGMVLGRRRRRSR
jgi:hypothetical protein